MITFSMQPFPIKPPMTVSVVVSSSSFLTAACAFDSVDPPSAAVCFFYLHFLPPQLTF